VHILFDPGIFLAQSSGGISRAFAELIAALDALDLAVTVDGRGSINHHLAALRRRRPNLAVLSRPHKPGGQAPLRLGPAARLAADLRFAALCRKAPPASVVHQSYYPVLNRTAGLPRVTTVHDMESERGASSSGRRLRSALKRRAVARADAIVAVSHATKADLMETWAIPEARIQVIGHGAPRLPPPSKTEPRLPPDYCLFVGRRAGYKNFATLVRALADLPSPSRPALVAVGGGAFTAEEQALIAQLGLTGQVHQISGGDAFLATAYAQARCLVYPSRFEGFGLPLLEAMTLGTPVLCSDIPVFREVAGEAALFCDTREPEALAAALSALLDDEIEQDRLRAAGTRRAAAFTWQACAEAHRALYARLA